MKKLLVVMTEFINDSNEWSWYDITRNDTPREAVRRYLKEYGLTGKIKVEKDPDLCIVDDCKVYYSEDADVRAYYVEIK